MFTENDIIQIEVILGEKWKYIWDLYWNIDNKPKNPEFLTFLYLGEIDDNALNLAKEKLINLNIDVGCMYGMGVVITIKK